MKRCFRTGSEQDTEELGRAVGEHLFPGAVLLLHGELGTGKTVFSRGVARALDVRGPVRSPTFTLLNIYNGRLPLYHFDLYRLEEEGLSELGLEEYLEGDGVCVVEWADRFPGYFAVPALTVHLSRAENSSGRQVCLYTADAKYAALLRDLEAGGGKIGACSWD